MYNVTYSIIYYFSFTVFLWPATKGNKLSTKDEKNY